MIVRKLSAKELAYYEAPYPTISSRKPLRVWPRQIPFDSKPKGVHNAVESYHNWLLQTPIPKLCFYAEPGLIINKELVLWMKENYENLETIDLGKRLHFVQEDHPHTIGQGILKWYRKLNA